MRKPKDGEININPGKQELLTYKGKKRQLLYRAAASGTKVDQNVMSEAKQGKDFQHGYGKYGF